MTTDEAIEQLKQIPIHDGVSDNYRKTIYDTIDTTIKALKQQPCEDAVSREAVINTLDKMDEALDTDRTVENYKMLLTECYKVLPPLLNQRKARTGDVFK